MIQQINDELDAENKKLDARGKSGSISVRPMSFIDLDLENGRGARNRSL